MDQATLIYAAIAALAGGFLSLYIALVLWSPSPMVTQESETKYRSHASPKEPLPLTPVSDPAAVDLTVVVPAYNETERLPAMMDSTIAHLTGPSYKNRTFEIIIVDDGSIDGTSNTSLQISGKYPKCNIRVVTLEKNLGKGGAVRHGMMYSSGRRLLMADADGASRFEDLELLWEAMDGLTPDGDNDGPAIVVGSRAHLVGSAAVVKRSLLRNILMHGLHLILRIVGVGHIHDTQCGFKLFSRSAARQIFPSQHLPTWIFDVELLLLAKQLRIPVAEVAIEWHEIPGSKLNVASASLQMLRDLLIVRANHMLGRWKPITGKAKVD